MPTLRVILIPLCYLLSVAHTFAQSSNACPENIGFEAGTFYNWEGFISTLDNAGNIGFKNPGIINGRHTIFKADSVAVLDPYGKFPVNCPNGSNYSIRLGNSSTNKEVDIVSYLFTVPANQNEFSLIYQFAVVFQDPGHLPYEQPKFSAKVYDESSGGSASISCSSFDFVASGGLPGFQLSTLGGNVYYRPWSPVTIKLVGYQGKTLRLEFTTNDCSKGGHFGYAYVDVNENCTSPISGNSYCQGDTSMTLTGPFGFSSYKWMTSDFSTVLGTSNTLKLIPPPLPGTKLALEVTPYPGAGCLDTLYTTIKYSPNKLNFALQQTVSSCDNKNFDLTLNAIKAGSDSDLKYTYFADVAALTYLPFPSGVKPGSTYYVKAINDFGCYEVKPITVNTVPTPIFSITNPLPVEAPCSVDITKSFSGNNTLAYSFWLNAQATQPLNNPTGVQTSGTYYVKGDSASGCSGVNPVTVVINPKVAKPPITGNNYCPENNQVILRGPKGFSGYKWFNNGAATVLSTMDSLLMVPAPAINTKIGLQLTTSPGTNCYDTLYTIINKYPTINFSLQPSIDVCIDRTTDLTSPQFTAGSDAGLNFTYYTDATAINKLTTPNAANTGATYYVQANNSNGCKLLKSITIVPVAKPFFIVSDPLPVNYPARIDLNSSITSNNNIVYTYWLDTLTTKPLYNPAKVDSSGIYYIKGSSKASGCDSIVAVKVIIYPPPTLQVKVPNAFSPNNDGINDVLKWKVEGFITLSTFKIFSRAGQLLFETRDPSRFWDGKFNGSMLPVGTYYWLLEGTDTYWGKPINQSGSITIVR